MPSLPSNSHTQRTRNVEKDQAQYWQDNQIYFTLPTKLVRSGYTRIPQSLSSFLPRKPNPTPHKASQLMPAKRIRQSLPTRQCHHCPTTATHSELVMWEKVKPNAGKLQITAIHISYIAHSASKCATCAYLHLRQTK